MSRSSTLILLGILVVLVPFSGLPVALRTVLAVIFGAAIFGIGFFMRGESVRAVRSEPLAAPTAPPTVVSAEPEPAAPHGVSPI